MIKSYKKLLNMESVAALKLEQDKLILEKLRNVLKINKFFIIKKLIKYLSNELKIDYKFDMMVDQDGNVADVLVKRDSNLFKQYEASADSLEFNVECFINKKMFNNKADIIILDMNSDEKLLNLEYLCDSLDYKNLSYSDEIVARLKFFLEYVIEMRMKFKKNR